MSIQELEKKWRTAEKERLKAETQKEALHRVDSKVKADELTLTREIEQFQTKISGLAKNVLEVARLQAVQEEALRLAKAVEKAVASTEATNDQMDNFVSALAQLNASIDSLTQKLSAEIDKQNRQRQLERETLDKLNKYLDNWL